jgi:hypothetical protein
METELRISRRFILQLLAAAAAMAFGERLTGAVRRHRRSESKALASCLTFPESAAAVGEAYLRERPAERDAAMLAATLRSRIDRSDPRLSGVPIETAPTAALRRALRRAATTDLAAGDSVIVDGWILSRTEAQLCALISCQKVLI